MKLTDTLQGLGRAISFHPGLRKITGGVTATVLLEQLIYWSDKTEDGWIYKTQKELEEETSLTRREQDTAKKLLKERQLIDYQRKGVPAKLYFKVDFDVLNERWASLAGCANLECTNSANSNGGKRQSITLDYHEITHQNGVKLMKDLEPGTEEIKFAKNLWLKCQEIYDDNLDLPRMTVDEWCHPLHRLLNQKKYSYEQIRKALNYCRESKSQFLNDCAQNMGLLEKKFESIKQQLKNEKTV